MNKIKTRILKWLVVIVVCSIALIFSGCAGTYYISDAEYSDLREEHASVTYYDNQIYWGWNSGYYYYYGKPHYYPWYYYYNTCPPSIYNTTTHVIIVKPVNKPTWRPNRPNKPNRPNWNNNRPNRPNKPNWNNNRPNRPNNNNKVIINKNKNNKVNINRSTNNKKKKRR